MFDIALKNIKARKLRSFLTIFAIVLAVMLFTTFGVFQQSFEDLLFFLSDPVKKLDLVIVQEKGNSFVNHNDYSIGRRSELDEAKYSELVNHPAISPYIDAKTNRVLIKTLEDLGEAQAAYHLWGIPRANDGQYHPEEFLGNAYLGVSQIADAQLEDTPHVSAIFAAQAAEYFGVQDKIHQVVTLSTSTGDYKVYIEKVLPPSPTPESFHDQFDFMVLMTLDNAHELLGNDQINYIRVVPQEISSVELVSLIHENIAGVDAKTHKEVMRDLEQSMGPMQISMNVLKYFVLVIAVLTILNTFFMAARERVREIATLKACGATNRVILEMFLSESVLISLIGSSVGVLLSLILVLVLATLSLGSFASLRTIPLSPLVFGFLIGLVTGPLAAVGPAIICTRQDPVRGLRYE